MKKVLEADGHVAVCGILFDTEEAFPKPESVTVPQEVVKADASESEAECRNPGAYGQPRA